MAANDPEPELDARFSGPNATATAWDSARAVLETAELFWISTVRPNGHPHVTPLPAVWHDDGLHFCTGADEQKGVNLARNANCTLTTGTNEWKSGLDLVVEGRAERVTDDAVLQVLAHLWSTKYDGDWQYDVHDGAFHHEAGAALVFRVSPVKILAFAKGDFAQTRFRFDDSDARTSS